MPRQKQIPRRGVKFYILRKTGNPANREQVMVSRSGPRALGDEHQAGLHASSWPSPVWPIGRAAIRCGSDQPCQLLEIHNSVVRPLYDGVYRCNWNDLFPILDYIIVLYLHITNMTHHLTSICNE